MFDAVLLMTDPLHAALNSPHKRSEHLQISYMQATMQENLHPTSHSEQTTALEVAPKRFACREAPPGRLSSALSATF